MIKRSEYEKLFTNQQATLVAPSTVADDLPDVVYEVVTDEEDEAEEEPTFVKTAKAKSRRPPQAKDKNRGTPACLYHRRLWGQIPHPGAACEDR